MSHCHPACIRSTVNELELSPTWVGGSSVPLDGDPQASCPAFLVLTGNAKAVHPFILSPVSHRRGRLVTEAFFYGESSPHVRGIHVPVLHQESSPHVRGIRFLARVITPPIRIPHSLCTVDELRIFLNGDPQASYLTVLVLAGNPEKIACPFMPSPVSHRRGCPHC